jgi:hypothetical protein
MPTPTPNAATPPSRRSTPEGVPWRDDPRSLQILSAEHSSLLSTRSLAYNEAFTRVGVFLTFVSTSFVALALISPAMSFGATFLGITAIVLAFDFIVGLMTLGRILGTTADDLRAVQGMARVRHGYMQVRPELRPYITTPTHDDLAAVMKDYRAPSSGLGGVLYAFTTSTGMVAVIVALLGGVLGGVLALLIGAGAGAAAAIGIGGAVLVFAVVAAGALRFFVQDQASLEVQFPSSGESSPAESA